MRVGGQNQAPPLYPGKEIWYPFYRRLGGPQGRSKRVQKISPLTGIRSPERPDHTDSLYQLRYPAPLTIYTSLRNLRMPTANIKRTIDCLIEWHNQLLRLYSIGSRKMKNVSVCGGRRWGRGDTGETILTGVNECTRRKPCPVARIDNTNTAKLTGLGSTRGSAVWKLTREVINFNLDINLLSALVERRRKELRSTDLKSGKQK